MRRRGSKNTTPAKTGQKRKRCTTCRRHRYTDNLKKTYDYINQKWVLVCANGCETAQTVITTPAAIDQPLSAAD